jgi:hypothetical protein
MCWTGCAPVRSQMLASATSRSARLSGAARTLISSWCASARSISATTASLRPFSPSCRIGCKACARARRALRSAGESMGGTSLDGSVICGLQLRRAITRPS